MNTRESRKPHQAGAAAHGRDNATVVQALAIQAEAGTPSAVEYLKARDIEASAIEAILSGGKPN